MRRLLDFVRDRAGSTAIEYGLIASLLAVALIAGLTNLGNGLDSTFTTLSGTINNNMP